MKTANAIIGGFITIVLLFGVLCKMMHWPGAGIMIVLSASSLAIYVYFAAVQNILSHKKNTLLKICNGLGAFVGSIVIIGFLFKIIIAALDTPILYLIVYAFRQKFNLKVGEEIEI